MRPTSDAEVEPFVIRPPRQRRQLLGTYALVGLAALTWGLVSSTGQETTNTVIYAVSIALLIAITGLGMTANASISPDGVRSRLFVPTVAPTSDVQAIELKARQIGLTRTITVVVQRTDGRSLRLSQTTVKDTPQHRAMYEAYLDEWRRTLGVG